MFVCAIAKPRFHPESGECLFDGKIGIWSFIERVAAQRNSANRPRGTMVVKLRRVNRVIYLYMFLDELIPGILTKYPQPDLAFPIRIQQDNAKPHVFPDNLDFVDGAANQGLQPT